MLEIIDLSQEIFTGMPVFPGLPEVEISMHASHEQWDGVLAEQATDSDVLHQLTGPGRFRFIGLPLKIRRGTGSPVRAIAVFEG